jgi:integrase
VIRSYGASLDKRVLPALGGHRLESIDRLMMHAYVDTLVAEGLDPSTIRNPLMPLRVIYRRAVSRGVVAINPVEGVELPAVRGRRDRVASPDEAERLLAALPVHDRPIWAVAIYSGLRAGELQALTWDCVDLAGGTIRVERAWDPKSKLYVSPKSRAGRRRVPILGVLRDILLDLRMAGSRDGLVLPGLSTEHFDIIKPAPTGAWALAGGRTQPDRFARVPAHVRLTDDRRRRQREGVVGLPGARQHRDHVRPLRAPDARRRRRSRSAGRRVP